MNNDANIISMDEIKMWLGELLIENKTLHRKIIALATELEEIKKGTLDNGVPLSADRIRNRND